MHFAFEAIWEQGADYSGRNSSSTESYSLVSRRFGSISRTARHRMAGSHAINSGSAAREIRCHTVLSGRMANVERGI